jgi:hypothetical protein
MFHFSNKSLDNCKICERPIDPAWGSGIGAVCQQCTPIRDSMDLVKTGHIRNIVVVPDSYDPVLYTFEVKIDNEWFLCGMPCRDWSCIVSGGTIPVGWFELNELFRAHHSL